MSSQRPYHRRNALFAWGAVAVLLVAGAVLAASGDFLWAAAAAVVAVLAAFPATVLRDPRAMPAWGIVAVATLPFLFRPVPSVTAGAAAAGTAAVALLVAIYLSAFTEVELTAQFAILLVLTTTIAMGTLWAAARGLADLYFGYAYLGGLDALELDLLLTVVGGVLASLVFEAYFRERNYGGLRGVPVEEV